MFREAITFPVRWLCTALLPAVRAWTWDVIGLSFKIRAEELELQN
jgi:hypothetical protein